MMSDSDPDLDRWLPRPAVRVYHRRTSSATPESLWEAARQVRLRDTRVLGRIVRWRIPGIPASITFDEMFRQPPFMVLEHGPGRLVSGLVGRIWTLRRDYPVLEGGQEFREWDRSGTARVVFANWVSGGSEGGGILHAESRVEVFGAQGRVGLAAVRPVVRAFQHLVGSDGVQAAVRRAEAAGPSSP